MFSLEIWFSRLPHPLWTISLDVGHTFLVVHVCFFMGWDYSLSSRGSLYLPPLTVRETRHKVTLRTHQAHSPRFLEVTSITFSCANQQELRKISKIMETRPSYRMGFLHQTVWDLIGTTYWGDPLNVGGSSTVNISGARRREANCIWLNIPSHSFINHLVKAVTHTPSHLHATLQLVTPHLPALNTKIHINTFAPSVPSLASSRKQSDWSQKDIIFHAHIGSQDPLPQELLYHQGKKKSLPHFKV